MNSDKAPILIAGRVPVGFLRVWLLGRRGLLVHLFDNNIDPQADPRAASTHRATLELLAEDGLAEHMARVWLVAPIFLCTENIIRVDFDFGSEDSLLCENNFLFC